MSIFFLLSGYVCAIKPIRLARAGQAEEARRVIASSAFRRIPRIVVPATLGTLFAWVLAQVGAFTLVPEVELDESWLSRTTPKRIPGFYPPIEEFFTQCVCPRLIDLINSLILGRLPITSMKQINGVWHGKCEDQCFYSLHLQLLCPLRISGDGPSLFALRFISSKPVSSSVPSSSSLAPSWLRYRLFYHHDKPSLLLRLLIPGRRVDR